MAQGILGVLPAGLRGYVAGEQMQNQRGVNQLQQMHGILGLQGMLEQRAMEQQIAPLKMKLLQAQVQGVENPAPTKIDGGGEWLFIDKTGNVVGRIPKTASPDTVLKEGGADRRHGQVSGNTAATIGNQQYLHGIPSASSLLGAQVSLAGMNRPVLNETLGGWLTPPPVGVPGIGAPRLPQAPQGQMPSAMDSTPRISPNMMVSPQDQARRDAEAARIRAAEGNGGAGFVPTSSAIPGFTPVPGLGQKPKPTAGQNAVDQAFAKEYVDFKAAGGYADIEKNIRQLAQASETLEKDDSLTGPIRGMYPDFVRSITNPQAVATKEQVQEVAQRNLRLVLGPQFTEKEGERLISRVYNDRLSTAENKKRVDNLIAQIRAAAQAKQSASEYFEQNGTLTGWNGRLPKFEDFLPKDRKEDKSNDVLKEADRILNGGR
jgi:hypothetical protein